MPNAIGTKPLAALSRKREELAEKIRGLQSEFNQETKTWSTPEAEAEWDSLGSEYDATMEEIRQTQTSDKVQRRLKQIEQRDYEGYMREKGPGDHSTFFETGDSQPPQMGTMVPKGHAFRDSHGAIIYAKKHDEPLALKGPEPWESPDYLGRLCLAIATNDNSHLTERELMNQQTGGNAGTGGLFLEPTVSSRYWDLARTESRMMQAGVQTLSVNDRQTKLVRVTQDPTSDWIPELGTMFYSDVTFDSVMVEPKKIAIIIPVSYELAEDSANAARIVEQTLRNHMAWAIDNVILNGTGTNDEPEGILANSNIPNTPTVGTPSDHSEIRAAIVAIKNANCYTPLSSQAWVANPENASTYDALADSTGQPIQTSPWITEIRKVEATGCPAGSMVVGDFSETYLCIRTNLRLQRFDTGTVSDQGAANPVNLLTDFAYALRAYARVDVVTTRPTWLHTLTGVTT